MKKINQYLSALFLSNILTLNITVIFYMINFFVIESLDYSFGIYNYLTIEVVTYILCTYLYLKENAFNQKIKVYLPKILLGVSIFCWLVYGVFLNHITETHGIDNGTEEYYHIYFPAFLIYLAVIFIQVLKIFNKKQQKISNAEDSV